MAQKTKIYRSKQYMDFVKTLECCVYERYGYRKLFGGEFCEGQIIPHHTETGGVGMKGSDLSCVPLCNQHHRRLHDNGQRNFDNIYALDLKANEVIRVNQLYIQYLEGK